MLHGRTNMGKNPIRKQCKSIRKPCVRVKHHIGNHDIKCIILKRNILNVDDTVVEINRDELYGEYVKNTHRIGQYGMDAYADGSPLTMEECIAFAEQILRPYKELYGWEFSLQRAYANSRRYKATAGRNGFIAMFACRLTHCPNWPAPQSNL